MTPPSRDEALAYLDNFVIYVDAPSLAEFLDRETKRQRIEELSRQFMQASQETHPDLPEDCEW